MIGSSSRALEFDLTSPFLEDLGPGLLDAAIPGAPMDAGPALEEAAASAGEALFQGTWADLFHGYLVILVVSFVVALVATPVMRRLAVARGIVDRPSDPRKVHRAPVAYLGGVAVFAGILAGILASFVTHQDLPLVGAHEFAQVRVPWSMLAGLLAITLAGLWDDVAGIPPRIKISMQLIAAALLALDDVGVRVAAGALAPIGRLIGNEDLRYQLMAPDWLPLMEAGAPLIHLDLVYWTGTAIIALFILGACNASNLIDGLDGLCAGTTAISAAALLAIALALGVHADGPLDTARIVLCMALLGACLGFLPHNFNPASIFLGDCGSMLLGYVTIVIILTLGDMGRTDFVAAGLIIYALPIVDTTLAIVRRKMAGKRMSDPDDQHLHHMLKRALGVKGAVFVLYGIALMFGTIGFVVTLGRARVSYALALVLTSYIGVFAVKIARRRLIEDQAAAARSRNEGAEARGRRPGRAKKAREEREPVHS